MSRLALLLMFACLLAACGQKGPLYFPDQAPAHKPHHATQLLSRPSADESRS